MPRCVASPDSESGDGDRAWCDEEDMGECEQLCYSQGEEGGHIHEALTRHFVGGEKQCECHPGYTLAADGHKCEDIDECQVLKWNRWTGYKSRVLITCFRIRMEDATKCAATDPGPSCASAPLATAAPSRVLTSTSVS